MKDGGIVALLNRDEHALCQCNDLCFEVDALKYEFLVFEVSLYSFTHFICESFVATCNVLTFKWMKSFDATIQLKLWYMFSSSFLKILLCASKTI